MKRKPLSYRARPLVGLGVALCLLGGTAVRPAWSQAAPQAAGPVVAQPAGPVVAQTVPMGVVIDKDAMFVDGVKGCSSWGSPSDFNQSVPTDSNGWPEADLVLIVKDDTYLRPEDPTPPSYSGYAGTYHLSFLGQATITPFFTTPTTTVPNQTVFTVQNQVYNPLTNTTTADIVVPQPAPGGDVVLDIDFSNTTGNVFPEHPVGGLINVKLIRPGYDPNTTQVFTNAYIKGRQGFSVMRCLDVQGTNNDLTTKLWAQRPMPTAAFQNLMSVEYLVMLANQAQMGPEIRLSGTFTREPLQRRAVV